MIDNLHLYLNIPNEPESCRQANSPLSVPYQPHRMKCDVVTALSTTPWTRLSCHQNKTTLECQIRHIYSVDQFQKTGYELLESESKNKKAMWGLQSEGGIGGKRVCNGCGSWGRWVKSNDEDHGWSGTSRKHGAAFVKLRICVFSGNQHGCERDEQRERKFKECERIISTESWWMPDQSLCHKRIVNATRSSELPRDIPFIILYVKVLTQMPPKVKYWHVVLVQVRKLASTHELHTCCNV